MFKGWPFFDKTIKSLIVNELNTMASEIRPFLKTFKLENFKAVQNSGTVYFTPLTVLIGNNGSGKSSLIEGLETYQPIVIDGLDKAMQHWYGFDHIWNKAVNHKKMGNEANGKFYGSPILKKSHYPLKSIEAWGSKGFFRTSRE